MIPSILVNRQVGTANQPADWGLTRIKPIYNRFQFTSKWFGEPYECPHQTTNDWFFIEVNKMWSWRAVLKPLGTTWGAKDFLPAFAYLGIWRCQSTQEDLPVEEPCTAVAPTRLTAETSSRLKSIRETYKNPCLFKIARQWNKKQTRLTYSAAGSQARGWWTNGLFCGH